MASRDETTTTMIQKEQNSVRHCAVTFLHYVFFFSDKNKCLVYLTVATILEQSTLLRNLLRLLQRITFTYLSRWDSEDLRCYIIFILYFVLLHGKTLLRIDIEVKRTRSTRPKSRLSNLTLKSSLYIPCSWLPTAYFNPKWPVLSTRCGSKCVCS